ncbi:MAG: hypothetical protein MJY90_05695 [Bacteroidaceae bacterium]|nr:hypothetical protein [Bacteroidaceae bacterium]
MKRITILSIMLAVTACAFAAKSTTKTVKGSVMYAVYFPWDLDKVTVSGTIDGKTYSELPLYHGVDFICQTLPGGLGHANSLSFEYCADDNPMLSGAYIIQFADNYDGLTVKFTFKDTATGTNADVNPSGLYNYYFTGSPEGRLMNLQGKPLYKFNVDAQRFEYIPEGKMIYSYESYIDVQNQKEAILHPYIAPQGSTGIERLNANKSRRQQGIYNLNGQLLAEPQHGINIIDGRKVFVNRQR